MTALASDSLFFTPKEMAKIKYAVQRNRNAGHAKHLIHMGSLIYFGEDRWVIWLLGRKWTPETKSRSITIQYVTPDSAKLTIKHPVLPRPRTITLHPHQSFNLLTGKVIEGF